MQKDEKNIVIRLYQSLQTSIHIFFCYSGNDYEIHSGDKRSDTGDLVIGLRLYFLGTEP